MPPLLVDTRVLQVGRDAGMPTGQVHSIAEGASGYIWFATPAGLARFDGKSVVAYGRGNGLATQGLRALLADAGGRLWIGSDAGIEVREPDGRFHPLAIGDDWNGGMIVSLAAGSDGSVWIATSQGLRRIRPDGALELAREFANSELVSALAVDLDGRVWLASASQGVVILDPEGRRLPVAASAHFAGVPSAFGATASGGMIIAGDRAVVELDRQGRTVRRMDRQAAESAPQAVLASGLELWLGDRQGCTRLRAVEDRWVLESRVLSDVAVNQISLDLAGDIWIATDSGGAYMVSVLRDSIHSLPLACSGQVFSLSPDGDHVLVGGDRCSARYSIATGRLEALPGFDEFRVWDLVRRADGDLWAATDRGLLRQHGKESPRPVAIALELLAQPARALLDHEGALWVAGVSGLARLDAAGARAILDHSGVSLGYVYSLAARGSEVLAGTLGRGLWIVSEEPPRQVTSAGLRSNGNVYAIDCRPDGGCVLVQDDQLLWLKGASVTQMETLPGEALAGWTVRFADPGDLWVGGLSGLRRYAFPERSPSLRLTRSMGLPGDEFTTSRSLLSLANGTLLCGLEGGLGIVDRGELAQFQRPPTVELVDVQWQDAKLDSSGGRLRVGYGRWKLDLEVFSRWRIDPANLQIRHRLGGLEESWTEHDPRDRRIHYSALPPGSYRFVAQAGSPITGWGPEVQLLSFEVLPPWWLSGWGVALAVLLVLLALASGWWIRARASGRRAALLEALVADRTARLAEANQKLERMALHDVLTELPNRRFFGQRFEAFHALAQRQGEAFGLAILDLDHFKLVNDRFGHDIGDDALCHVARALERAIRLGDVVARFAGEEFVVLFAPGQQSDFAAAAERLRAAVESHPLELADGTRLQMTTSVGWSAWRREDSEPGDQFRRADEALYRAKKTRNSTAGDEPDRLPDT
ncbi:MAG: diguanylate cyclase [Thermoanaerobaculia bacterium]